MEIVGGQVGVVDLGDFGDEGQPRHGLCQVHADGFWVFELAVHPGAACAPQLPEAAHAGIGP